MARLNTSPADIFFPTPALLTDDCQKILQFAADCFDSGQGSALVTLVEIRGSAARPVGAQMAVRGDAHYCGYVSGGCTEAAIATEAAEAIAAGGDRLLRLGQGSPFFDITLPCGGGITLAIHVIRDSMVLRTTLFRLARRERVGLAYDPDAQALTPDFSGCSGWRDCVFLRPYHPRVRVVLSGGLIEVDIVSKLAVGSGFEACPVTSDTLLRTSLDRDTAVAILHHDLDREMPLLKAAPCRKAILSGYARQPAYARKALQGPLRPWLFAERYRSHQGTHRDISKGEDLRIPGYIGACGHRFGTVSRQLMQRGRASRQVIEWRHVFYDNSLRA
jgi:xanthine dehydrogenase accessory factor